MASNTNKPQGQHGLYIVLWVALAIVLGMLAAVGADLWEVVKGLLS